MKPGQIARKANTTKKELACLPRVNAASLGRNCRKIKKKGTPGDLKPQGFGRTRQEKKKLPDQ